MIKRPQKSKNAFLTFIAIFLSLNLFFSGGYFSYGQESSPAQPSLINDLSSQIQNKQNLIKELEKKVAELRNAIKDKQSTQSTLKKQIASMEAEINRLESEIQLTREKISETNLQIQKLDQEMGELEKKINNHKEYLSNAIRIINEYDKETAFEIILENNNLSDFLDQIEYIENLQKNAQEKLVEIKILKAQTDNDKQKQEDFKNSLESLHQELKSKDLVLNFQVSDKEYLLTSTKNQEKNYQAQLKQVLKQQQDIEKEIYQLEDKLRMAIDPNSLPTAQKGLLDWPIKNAITQTYGPTSITGFINNVYTFHNGIDLRARIGDAIKTAGDGVVVGVGNDGKYAYGRWIAINHQNGLITLYGHLSVQKVSVGQQVKRGEVIGYAGNTGFSTGSHLHFTVYATNTFKIESRWYGALPIGGSLNPLNYLD